MPTQSDRNPDERPTHSSSEQQTPIDVVIGGGGLSGRLMALALAETFADDITIAIVDPAGQRTPASGGDNSDPRCPSIAAASKQALDTLGVWYDVAESAADVRKIKLTDSALETVARIPRLSWTNTIEDPFEDAPQPASWIVPNAVLSRAVSEALQRHASVQYVHARIAAVTEGSAWADIALQPGACGHGNSQDHLRARLLIAADGGRSPLRRMMGRRTVARAHKHCAIVTTVTHSLPHDGTALQHFLPSGPFAILPLPDNRSCVTWSERDHVAQRIMGLSDADFLSELEQRFGGHLGVLTCDGPRATFPISTRIAHAMTAKRFALIGDAARTVHPIAGQGLNLAIRDIAALTECVADSMRAGLDAGDATALARYSRWRRFDAVSSAGAFAALNRVYSSENVLARSVRDFGMGLIDRLPPVKKRLVQEAAGLSGTPPKLLRGQMI
ncbi:MAG: FAD-dependent monooxygenase [Pseudomonadota bacterium]